MKDTCRDGSRVVDASGQASPCSPNSHFVLRHNDGGRKYTNSKSHLGPKGGLKSRQNCRDQHHLLRLVGFSRTLSSPAAAGRGFPRNSLCGNRVECPAYRTDWGPYREPIRHLRRRSDTESSWIRRPEKTDRGASRRPCLSLTRSRCYGPQGSTGFAPPLNAVAIR